ncbi:MAG: hypothetical protein NW223_15120 [Hyphomicrobiaceae bacterium]|nr:hypothetical protein [Hyphomicrobiaceae bacterium]
MTISVEIDEKLMDEARRITGEPDDRKIAERVFREFIERQAKLQGMLDLVGKVRLRDDYDYKALRAGDLDSH